MTIVILNGGLGNQLFQVCAGLCVASQKGEKLRIDARLLAHDKQKRHLTIPALGLPIMQIGRGWQFVVEAVLAITRLAPKWPLLHNNLLWSFIQDKNNGTETGLSCLRSSLVTVLEGYWQSSSYSEGCLNYLQRRILSHPLSGPEVEEAAKEIETHASVAIHVRRGDYVDDPLTHSFHGNCTTEYYGKALETLRSRTLVEHIFVFSDDIAWAVGNLQFSGKVTFVNSDRRFSDVDEFLLMTRCRHFVTANSTFSWWAARLAKNEDKIVVAPRKWFASASTSTDGLFPSGWILVE